MNYVDITKDYLYLITTGKIEEAYSKYISSDFRHHNQYMPGDATSLKSGMIDNDANFPNKHYTLGQIIAQDDKVVAHGLIKLNDDLQLAVVHIFRFEGGKIVELRDIAQKLEVDSPNKNGVL